MFKYLLSEQGFRRGVDINPKSTNLRERFALWIVKRFAPRLHVVEVLARTKPITMEEAGDVWRKCMTEWNRQRLEDVSLLELSINETTGEFE
ncbi:hypothetical protein LCGC14_1778810 [marine sediment metagenome]|uniref:Uncharacterized protein n=1 Tax=marine sediment metagenome TaxID=412755 RepID=A0A0F8Z8H8_9ZZZZ